MKISRYQCWIKYLWRSLWTMLSSGYPMSGHDYQEVEYRRNCDVVISKCEICEKYDISWSGGVEIENADEFYNKFNRP